MIFEPFKDLSFFDFLLSALIWGSSGAAIFVAVTFLLFFKDKDIKHAIRMVALFGAGMGVFISGLVVISEAAEHNRNVALSNVSKKYEVESITYQAKGRGVPSPNTEEPLNVIIKVDGKSRPAVITQNLDTHEPTLTDFDTGEPMDDIRRE